MKIKEDDINRYFGIVGSDGNTAKYFLTVALYRKWCQLDTR